MTKHSIQSNDTMQADDLRTPPSVERIPWWVSIVVILGALLTISGAVISKVAPTMLTNGSPMTGAARVYADYLFARNLPLAAMLLLLLAMRARQMLAGFMVLTALIQMVDVLDDLARGEFLLVPGLLVFALVFLGGAWRLSATLSGMLMPGARRGAIRLSPDKWDYEALLVSITPFESSSPRLAR